MEIDSPTNATQLPWRCKHNVKYDKILPKNLHPLKALVCKVLH